MSIHELIGGYTRFGGGGELVRLLPSLPTDPVVRTMFIAPDIAELLEPPWGGDKEEDRCARLRGDLEGFVKGDVVGICLTPGKGREWDRMAILDPPSDGLWDVRAVDPSPGLRVLGGFVERDIFIGLRWYPRSCAWRGREPLRSGDSRAWRDAILATSAAWRKLFFTYKPKGGVDPDEVLSKYAVGRPISER